MRGGSQRHFTNWSAEIDERHTTAVLVSLHKCVSAHFCTSTEIAPKSLWINELWLSSHCCAERHPGCTETILRRQAASGQRSQKQQVRPRVSAVDLGQVRCANADQAPVADHEDPANPQPADPPHTH